MPSYRELVQTRTQRAATLRQAYSEDLEKRITNELNKEEDRQKCTEVLNSIQQLVRELGYSDGPIKARLVDYLRGNVCGEDMQLNFLGAPSLTTQQRIRKKIYKGTPTLVRRTRLVVYSSGEVFLVSLVDQDRKVTSKDYRLLDRLCTLEQKLKEKLAARH